MRRRRTRSRPRSGRLVCTTPAAGSPGAPGRTAARSSSQLGRRTRSHGTARRWRTPTRTRAAIRTRRRAARAAARTARATRRPSRCRSHRRPGARSSPRCRAGRARAPTGAPSTARITRRTAISGTSLSSPPLRRTGVSGWDHPETSSTSRIRSKTSRARTSAHSARPPWVTRSRSRSGSDGGASTPTSRSRDFGKARGMSPKELRDWADSNQEAAALIGFTPFNLPEGGDKWPGQGKASDHAGGKGDGKDGKGGKGDKGGKGAQDHRGAALAEGQESDRRGHPDRQAEPLVSARRQSHRLAARRLGPLRLFELHEPDPDECGDHPAAGQLRL